MTGMLRGQSDAGHIPGTNRCRFAVALTVVGPMLSVAAFAWMIMSVAQCQVFDLRIVASPLVGVGCSLAALTLAAWCLVLRPTDGRLTVLIIATLEVVGFGWTLVWFGLCIPAAP
jgi:hypothetical protein